MRKNRLIQLAAVFTAIVMIFTCSMIGIIGIADALLISLQEHQKYVVQEWRWDRDFRRNVGLMSPQLIIENETASRLEGYVADANGTRIEIYDDEHLLNIRYLSNITASEWEMAGRLHDGYFAIDIPDRYSKADTIKIHVGKHYYVVDNGTWKNGQTHVFINSATIDFRTNSTLDLVETEPAQVKDPTVPAIEFPGGSLIDWILSQNAMLPIRSPDPGE